MYIFYVLNVRFTHFIRYYAPKFFSLVSIREYIKQVSYEQDL